MKEVTSTASSSAALSILMRVSRFVSVMLRACSAIQPNGRRERVASQYPPTPASARISGKRDENGAADHGQLAVDGIERCRHLDVVGASPGLHRPRRDAVARPRRSLRARSQHTAALAYGDEIAVHLQFADHLSRGRHFVPVHLVEFVGEQDGRGVGLRSQGGIQTGNQRSREFAIQEDAEDDEQEREERQV